MHACAPGTAISRVLTFAYKLSRNDVRKVSWVYIFAVHGLSAKTAIIYTLEIYPLAIIMVVWFVCLLLIWMQHSHNKLILFFNSGY